MAWKKDEAGNIVVDDAGNPVLIQSDGREQAIDDGYIGKLNAEAATRRRELGEAKDQLSKYDGIDIDEAKKALETTKNIDLSKMVAADKLDEVRAEVSKSYQTKLDELNKGLTEREQQIHGLLVSNAFKGSKFLTESTVLPPDVAEAYFGKNFKVENGRAVGLLNGDPIYSSSEPGQLASVDEALQVMVDKYPNKDSILRGSGANGSGSQGWQGGHPVAKVMQREQFTRLSPSEQMGFVKEGGQIQ